MTEQDKTILKAICRKTGDNPNTVFANIYLIEKEIGELNADIWLLGWLCSKETLLAVWGEEDMYLIDTSPDWAHDMGDTETEWVTESELKKYCDAQLKAFQEEHPRTDYNKVSYDVLTQSIISRWQNPFEFAIMELPTWQVRDNQMSGFSAQERLAYIGKYLEGKHE